MEYLCAAQLWTLVYAYFPAAFFVLDIFDVLEHLGKAALLFYDEDSPQARQFITDRLRMLLRTFRTHGE